MYNTLSTCAACTESMSAKQYFPTACPLDCPDTCGILAQVKNGKVTDLRADPANPYTGSFLCRKIRSYPKRLYDAGRILYPMLRSGAKGSGQFQRISWDEALAIFAEKLQHSIQHFGSESVLPFQYAGNMGIINRNACYSFFNKLNSSQLLETICSAAASESWHIHLGSRPGSPPHVALDSDIIIAWGINCKISNIHFWHLVKKAHKRGARLIVIDPYKTPTAKSADWYLPIQPGGDAGLALGAIKAMLENGLLDRDMLDSTTTDFSLLEHYLLATPWTHFTSLAGLPYQTIATFAKTIASHPRTFLRIGYGLSRNSQAGNTVRSILSFAAACGLLAGGHGRGVLMSSRSFLGDMRYVRFPELRTKSTRVINMVHLGSALTDHIQPVRFLMVHNANPAVVAPDSGHVRKGLEREDLFTVVHEHTMTPTARYADLLLPATTFLENRDIYAGYGHFYMCVADRVISPVGESRSNFDLFQDVARYMGFNDPPFLQSLDERIRSYIEHLAGFPEHIPSEKIVAGTWYQSTRMCTEESFVQKEKIIFKFSTGNSAEIPSLPQLMPGKEFGNKVLQADFPFKLITPPCENLLNSTFGDQHTEFIGEVLIHPEDAQLADIADGDTVLLANQRGQTARIAKVTDDTQQGLLVAEGLFWGNDQYPDGINTVIAQSTTDIGQGPTFHEARVTLSLLQKKW